MTHARPFRLARSCVFLGPLAAALLWAGCEQRERAEEPTVDGKFGDPYEIVLGRTPADPDMPPALVDDSLHALLAYTGGCENHDFDLAYEVAADTARLWLRHDADGDDCEALLSDEVHLPVPEEARTAPTIVLLNPTGAEPFVVRWGD